MTIIDTHLHLWDLSQLRIPWLDGERTLLKRNYTEEDYLAAAGFEDIQQAVYVEVNAAQEDRDKENHFAAERCAAPDSIIGGAVISGNLSTPTFPEYLAAQKGNWLKGVRQLLHVPASPPGRCLQQTFVDNVNYLGKSDLHFEASVRCEELGDIVTLAQKCPHTRIIITHMGNVDSDIIAYPSPTPSEKEYADAWRKNIRDLAALDNVVCKVSGLHPASCCTAAPLLPAVGAVLEAFNANRLIFGGDFPLCNASTGLIPWIEALIEITKPYGEAFQKKLFAENALRIYRLSPKGEQPLAVASVKS